MTIPATVTIPYGATRANFTITTHTTGPDALPTITASYNGTQFTSTLDILGTNPHLVGFALAPNHVFDGQAVVGSVSLRAPAPLGGVRITLTNSHPTVATCPATITIPRGAVGATFNTTAHYLTTFQATTMTASYGGVTFQQTLAVSPIDLQSLDLSVNSVTGGTSVTGVVRIPIAAPSGGYRVTLSSSNTGAATVPASVTIPYRGISASFTITTKPVPGTTFLNITATHGVSSYSRQLQVLPPEVNTFTVSPHSVQGGHNVSGTITLTGKAPTGGVVVHIQANPNLAGPVNTVTVHAGSTSVSFSIATQAVAGTTAVTLYGNTFNVQRTTTLTLTH